jgi:hypothetical protein
MYRSLASAFTASLVFAFGPTFAAPASADCGPPQLHQESTSTSVRSFVKQLRMRVLTFEGYSGAQYEDSLAMLRDAERVLDTENPKEVLVNIGATAEGIGAVYELAKRKGFTTLGIVSSLAQVESVPLSPCVDHVFFIKDTTWGGQLPNSKRLAPTSAAIVANSSIIVGIGGGEIARDEMLAAKRLGKRVRFIPADMNHELARQKATKRRLPTPTDFRGAAHAVFGENT